MENLRLGTFPPMLPIELLDLCDLGPDGVVGYETATEVKVVD